MLWNNNNRVSGWLQDWLVARLWTTWLMQVNKGQRKWREAFSMTENHKIVDKSSQSHCPLPLDYRSYHQDPIRQNWTMKILEKRWMTRALRHRSSVLPPCGREPKYHSQHFSRNRMCHIVCAVGSQGRLILFAHSPKLHIGSCVSGQYINCLPLLNNKCRFLWLDMRKRTPGRNVLALVWSFSLPTCA